MRSELGAAVAAAVKTATGEIADLPPAAAVMESNVLTASHYCDPSHADAVLVAEQALRLAALFHDLGHLPLSHDFEFGLEKYWFGLEDQEKQESPLRTMMEQRPGQAAIHERIGHQLALLLLKELFSGLEVKSLSDAARIVFELARQILESLETPDPNQPRAALEFLNSVTAGELDVDRCDYILRDARNHGFEFASYDLARLLDNLVVGRRGASFVLAVRPHGLSALESFVVSRYRSHQYGVRHHKVAQIGAALRYSIAQVLASGIDGSIADFRNDLGAIANPGELTPEERSELLERFASYDDVWWLALTRRYEQGASDEWVSLVCWRSPGPWSLWKRVGDFPVPLKEWNQLVAKLKDLDTARRWAHVVEELESQGVLVMAHDFAPWKADPKQSDDSLLGVASEDGSLTPVTRLSPVVRALGDAWMSDIQVQAFATSDSGVSAADVIQKLGQALRGDEEAT